jgi:hypothetical protein
MPTAATSLTGVEPAPPSDEQIERLLYPELHDFPLELGGQRFALRELPAITEKKLLRLVEQRLPAILQELLSLDERLGENAGQAFTRLLARGASALDLVTDACVLVLDPGGDAGITRDFVQQHASTSRQLGILQAQLMLNGARDFLSRVWPGVIPAASETPDRGKPAAAIAIPASPPPSLGSNSCISPPAPSAAASPLASFS